MATLQTTRLSSRPLCPVCSACLDGATGRTIPSPDDLTVCVYCGAFLTFTKDMQLRALTLDEWAHLDAEAQDELVKYLNMTQRLRRRPTNQ